MPDRSCCSKLDGMGYSSALLAGRAGGSPRVRAHMWDSPPTTVAPTVGKGPTVAQLSIYLPCNGKSWRWVKPGFGAGAKVSGAKVFGCQMFLEPTLLG